MAVQLLVFVVLLQLHLGITHYGSEQIIEIVCYAACQLADRLHLLGLNDLFLKTLALQIQLGVCHGTGYLAGYSLGKSDMAGVEAVRLDGPEMKYGCDISL